MKFVQISPNTSHYIEDKEVKYNRMQNYLYFRCVICSFFIVDLNFISDLMLIHKCTHFLKSFSETW